MRIFVLGLLLTGMVLLCGCSATSPQYAESPPPVSPTDVGEPSATTALPTMQTPTPEPEPFPGALDVGDIYRYGTEEELREVTIYKYSLQESYEFLHPDWGFNYGTAEPAPGNQFCFVFLRIEHKGTKKELGAPYPASINTFYDGSFYAYRTDREGSVTRVLDFSGDEDYYGGIIHIYEKREGFLIYEIPGEAESGEIYVQVNLGSSRVPVWKLE